MTDRTYTETEVQAPERVWRVKPWIPSQNKHGLVSWPVEDQAGPGATEYVRADVAQALVAAALTEAAGLCEQFADTELTATSPAYAAGHSDGADRCEQAILALITPGASAALDRMLTEAEQRGYASAMDAERKGAEAAAIRAGAGKGET